jgi:hypothetical protein
VLCSEIRAASKMQSKPKRRNQHPLGPSSVSRSPLVLLPLASILSTMSPTAQRESAVCIKMTTKMCPCQTVTFCSTEHQKLVNMLLRSSLAHSGSSCRSGTRTKSSVARIQRRLSSLSSYTAPPVERQVKVKDKAKERTLEASPSSFAEAKGEKVNLAAREAFS